MGCHALLQRIFPIQGLNPQFLHLLNCRQILYPLSHLGSPNLFYPEQNKYVHFRQAGLLHTNNCLWNSTGHSGSMIDRKRKKASGSANSQNHPFFLLLSANHKETGIEARSPWFQTSPNSSEGRNPTCWSWPEGSIYWKTRVWLQWNGLGYLVTQKQALEVISKIFWSPAQALEWKFSLLSRSLKHHSGHCFYFVLIWLRSKTTTL